MVSALFPIKIDQAVVSKRTKRILGPVTAEIESNGITIIIGPNGAGKTTLLRLIHGLERVAQGGVFFATKDQNVIRRKQCFVFQKPIVLRRSALQNVAYPLIMHGMRQAQALERAREMLVRVGLGESLETRATFLSGGEAQKLAIARALVTEPELLILDEPTASLDSSAMRDIEALVREVSSDGVEIIMTTHDMGQARRLAQRIIFLHDGHLLEKTEASSFWRAPKSDKAQRFIRGEIV